MAIPLKDVTGTRGESILELCLTNYSTFSEPPLWPGFLGDKWPGIDFYVELLSLSTKKLLFFGQVKSTGKALGRNAVRISSKRNDIEELLKIPAPTYIFGVHEPTQRVFVRSVHEGTPVKAITSIPISHELHPANLRLLHQEVESFWSSNAHKPKVSAFS